MTTRTSPRQSAPAARPNERIPHIPRIILGTLSVSRVSRTSIARILARILLSVSACERTLCERTLCERKSRIPARILLSVSAHEGLCVMNACL